jgi:hypothetical protein
MYFVKFRPLGGKFFHTNGRADGHDEACNHFCNLAKAHNNGME